MCNRTGKCTATEGDAHVNDAAEERITHTKPPLNQLYDLNIAAL